MRHPSMPGNSAFCALSQVGCLNKTQPSAFHGPNTPEKTTVQTRLNNKKPPVEHLCWINAVFRAGSHSVSSAKNNPILRPMDGNSHPIGDEGGLNLYGFVGNDGVDSLDIVGLCECKVEWFKKDAKWPGPEVITRQWKNGKVEDVADVPKTPALPKDDLNLAARIIYAEAQGGTKGTPTDDHYATASTMMNRFGTWGIAKSLPKTLNAILTGGAYESYTKKTKKFTNSAPDKVKDLNDEECEDLKAAIESMKQTSQKGAKFRYTNMLENGSRTSKPTDDPDTQSTVHGANEFWIGEAHSRDSKGVRDHGKGRADKGIAVGPGW